MNRYDNSGKDISAEDIKNAILFHEARGNASVCSRERQIRVLIRAIKDSQYTVVSFSSV